MFFPTYFYNSFFTNIVNLIQIKTEKELFLKINNYFLIFISLFLKLNNFLQYKILNDLIIIDYPNRKKRYQIIYYFLSIINNMKLFVFFDIEETKFVPSMTTIYDSSNWLEREAYDMFGIFFSNHKDLRRILTDYGFDGYPLRKEFPLSGFFEIYFDETTKKIVYDEIELMQEYRFFDFKSPWETRR